MYIILVTAMNCVVEMLLCSASAFSIPGKFLLK